MSIVPSSACEGDAGVRGGLEFLGLGSPVSLNSPAPLCPPAVSHSTRSSPRFFSDRPSSSPQSFGPLDSHQQPDDLVGNSDEICSEFSANVDSHIGEPRVQSANSSHGTSSRDANKNGSPQRSPKRNLHRIAEVRKSQGISERTICKRLNIDLPTLRQIEDPAQDLTLADLVRVQQALDVPLVDLLEDSNSLARPIHERAKLVKIMKTVAALEEASLNCRPKRLVEMLREQLIDLMPELAQVGSWPQYGSRRGAASIARVLAQEISVSQIPTSE